MPSSYAGADLLTNQRTAARTVFHRRGYLRLTDGPVLPIKTIDISSSGLSLITQNPLPFKKHCSLKVSILHQGEPTELKLDGIVCYCILAGTEGFRVGIQYARLEPGSRQIVECIIESGA
jgi:hypothetical protein